MTTDAAPRLATPRIFAAGYRRLRTAHPVSVLRWLRNGMLLCVLAAALLYLWVATQAGGDIGTARGTQQAVGYIGKAEVRAKDADLALRSAFKDEDIALTGAGPAYLDDTAQAIQDLTLAAETNAAGPEGTSIIQFTQDQLEQYLQLSENAVLDYGLDPGFGKAAETYTRSIDLPTDLRDLETTESTAFYRQRGTWPLDPEVFWWVLLGPVVGMLFLTVATAHVLARHFRRQVGRWLWGSLLATVAIVVTVGTFNTSDERHLSPDPWAGHPVTLTCALLLFVLAAVLAYVAYRPRLAAYRFESS